jgi:hypothetical protein
MAPLIESGSTQISYTRQSESRKTRKEGKEVAIITAKANFDEKEAQCSQKKCVVFIF